MQLPRELLKALPPPPGRMFQTKHAGALQGKLKTLGKLLAIAGVGALSQDFMTAAASGTIVGPMVMTKGPLWKKMLFGAIPAAAGRGLARTLERPRVPAVYDYDSQYNLR